MYLHKTILNGFFFCFVFFSVIANTYANDFFELSPKSWGDEKPINDNNDSFLNFGVGFGIIGQIPDETGQLSFGIEIPFQFGIVFEMQDPAGRILNPYFAQLSFETGVSISGPTGETIYHGVSDTNIQQTYVSYEYRDDAQIKVPFMVGPSFIVNSFHINPIKIGMIFNLSMVSSMNFYDTSNTPKESRDAILLSIHPTLQTGLGYAFARRHLIDLYGRFETSFFSSKLTFDEGEFFSPNEKPDFANVIIGFRYIILL